MIVIEENNEVLDLTQETNVMSAVSKAEFDVQVSTAKRYPRSLSQFKRDAMDLITLDEVTADSCVYRLPRAGKFIPGRSIRFAEIVAASYGNLMYFSRIVDIGEKIITAQGVCWDMQKNVKCGVEVTRRITNKKGIRYNDDMIVMAANAAQSIALRNAILKIVPAAITESLYQTAQKVAVGDAMTLNDRRQKMIDYLTGSLNVSMERILARCKNAKGIEDITLEDVANIKGVITAVKDGDVSLETAFPEHATDDDGKSDPPRDGFGFSKKEEVETIEPEKKPDTDELLKGDKKDDVVLITDDQHDAIVKLADDAGWERNVHKRLNTLINDQFGFILEGIPADRFADVYRYVQDHKSLKPISTDTPEQNSEGGGQYNLEG